jgi:hypothetical protein
MTTESRVTMTFATVNIADVTQGKGDRRGISSVQVGIFAVRATMTHAKALVSIRSSHHNHIDGGEINVILDNPD